MSQLQRNLAYLIAKRGINPTQLSKATGVPQPTIKRILDGTSGDPRTATVEPLADYFGCTTAFLRTADIEGIDEVNESIADAIHRGDIGIEKEAAGTATLRSLIDEIGAAPALRRFKNVPIVGTVEGGPEGYLSELGYPVGHGDGLVEFPAKDKNAYALRVRGESMRPRIKSGEFIIVEPNTVTNPGDDVVVICKDGRKMVKELLYVRDGEVTLGSINNGFKPLSIPLEEIDAMHYVAAIVPRGAFYRPN